MKFESQICTTKEQSERLLALGLKRETADMCIDNDDNLTELLFDFDKILNIERYGKFN